MVITVDNSIHTPLDNLVIPILELSKGAILHKRIPIFNSAFSTCICSPNAFLIYFAMLLYHNITLTKGKYVYIHRHVYCIFPIYSNPKRRQILPNQKTHPCQQNKIKLRTDFALVKVITIGFKAVEQTKRSMLETTKSVYKFIQTKAKRSTAFYDTW